MINATPVRPLTSASPSGLPTPGASTPVPPAATPPTPPAANGGGMKPVPKKRFSMKMILGLIVFMIVAVGAVAGFYLTQMNQDVRQQASVGQSCGSGGSCKLGGCGQGFENISGFCGGSGEVCCRATAPVVNNCAGDGYQCQSGTSCSNGFVPATDKTCAAPGSQVCCKPQTGTNPASNTCMDIPGNQCNPTCTGNYEVAPGGRTCANGQTCCQLKPSTTSCPAGSTRIGTTLPPQCKCDNTGATINTSGSCPAPTSCGSYKAKGKCEQPDDAFTCLWDGGVCKKLTNISSCGTYTNPATCKTTDTGVACTWSNTTNSCVAATATAPTTCAGHTNQFACNQANFSGQTCTWNQATSKCVNRTSTTSCPAILNQQQCIAGNDSVNCRWNAINNTCIAEAETSYCDRSSPNTTQCTDKAVGTACKTTSGASGSCSILTSGGANTECECKTAGGAVGGSRALCPNPPNLPAVKYVRFTCPNGCTKGADGAFHCYEQREDFTTDPGGLKNATDCGQVDVLSGTNDSSYCGYTVNTCLESRCQKQPTTSPTPTASPIGNMCINITMAVNGAAATSTTKPKIGDRLTFTCAQVPNATRYRFRVLEPGGSRVNLNGTGRVSQQYGITVAGTFKAECSACTGADNSTCTDWPSREN